MISFWFWGLLPDCHPFTNLIKEFHTRCNILHILHIHYCIFPSLRNLVTHLAQVLFDSGRDVASSLRDEAEQTPQLVDPELQRFSPPCLEGLPGPLYGQLFPGHLTHRTNNRCQSRASSSLPDDAQTLLCVCVCFVF